MERLVIVVIVAVVAITVAAIVQRRQPGARPVPTGAHVPTQLHRDDFPRPGAPWLVVAFTSATCSTCAGMWDKARHLASDSVAVTEVEYAEQRALHERYGIDTVPTIVVADADGVVGAAFVGPATATDLWAAVAELREPGSLPGECDAHMHDTSR